jgi:hypothetical protein
MYAAVTKSYRGNQIVPEGDQRQEIDQKKEIKGRKLIGRRRSTNKCINQSRQAGAWCVRGTPSKEGNPQKGIERRKENQKKASKSN